MPNTSNTLRARSPGKLNLTFDILGDLPSGYHEVETLMQTVDLEDEIEFTFEPAQDFDVEISSVDFAGPKGDVPLNQDNLIAKAASLFRNQLLGKSNQPSGESNFKVKVSLQKSVPVAGGMGGGSGNAAATLMVLNTWLDFPFTEAEIASMASQLGADVPFFIGGGTQIGTHKGEVLSRVNLASSLNFLIVGPKLFGLQTPEIYRAYDENKENRSTALSAKECADALQDGDMKMASKKFGNVFEPIVFSKRPELQFIHSRLNQLGGLCTHMTGSGPTIYLFAENKSEAESIQDKLALEQKNGVNGWSSYPDLVLNTWIATSTPHGVSIS